MPSTQLCTLLQAVLPTKPLVIPLLSLSSALNYERLRARRLGCRAGPTQHRNGLGGVKGFQTNLGPGGFPGGGGGPRKGLGVVRSGFVARMSVVALLQFRVIADLRLSAILLSELALFMISYSDSTARAAASFQTLKGADLCLQGVAFLCAWPFHGWSLAVRVGWLQDWVWGEGGGGGGRFPNVSYLV